VLCAEFTGITLNDYSGFAIEYNTNEINLEPSASNHFDEKLTLSIYVKTYRCSNNHEGSYRQPSQKRFGVDLQVFCADFTKALSKLGGVVLTVEENSLNQIKEH